MMDVSSALFWVSFLCVSAILILGFVDLWNDRFTFWPPPEKGSWQDRSFIWLFRGMLYPLVLLSVRVFEQTDYSWLRLGLGGTLLILGFGTAIASTLNLGWKNAFGDRDGLVTNGWFSLSRNPVYVVSWFGMAGWALLVQSVMVSIILVLWALIYLIAIFLEERWLEQVYGEEFLAYKSRVRRFI